jgi:penicillin-binding protein 1C
VPDDQTPRYDPDDDIPFRLPKAEEDDYVDPNDDTDEMPALTTPNMRIIEPAPQPNKGFYSQPTMPIPREPGMPDPKRTVIGNKAARPEDYAAQQQQTQRNQPPPQQNRYQNPVNYPAPPQRQASNVPPPPADGSGTLKIDRKPPKNAPKRRRLGCLNNGCLLIFAGVVASFCGGLTLLSVILLLIAQNRLTPIIDAGLNTIDQYEAFQTTFYYDRNGTLLYETFGEGRREYAALDQIPQNLINATLAVEDDNFYSNPGIEVAATIRATLQYAGLLEGSTGGSTITQQLVRNVAFDYEKRTERSISRKAEEILLAIAITQRLSKDEILEMYLNEIYYGNLAYGAKAAAQTIFGKELEDLTLGEAALLAGLPQAPAELDPLNPDPEVQERVLERWRIALDAMVRQGYITSEERNTALSDGLQVYQPEIDLLAPHFTLYAQDELQVQLTALGYTPEDIARGGFQVVTTVDLALNTEAQTIIQEQVARLAGNRVSNGAVLVTKPLTGEILAMVGSADYENDAIDGRVNVATARRQPGSTAKGFTYAAALENGFSAADVIWDTPVRSIPVPGQSTWPVNYDGAYHGPVNMRAALANSYNVPAVQILQQAVGVEGLLQFMNRLGITSLGTDASLYGPSLTLGGGEITLEELTRGYSVFANGGSLVNTTAILCIATTEGEVIYQYEGGCPPRYRLTENTIARTGLGRQVLDARVAYLISDILADNNARTPAMGSNSPLRTDGIYTSVKTGTTNDFKDNWTVGFTHNVAVGVWVGNSDGTPMVNTSGLTGAAPIWNSVITTIYNDPRIFNLLAIDGTHQPDQPNPPSAMTLQQVCDVRRLTEGVENCPSLVAEWTLDFPAGIPDSEGNLNYPQARSNQTAPTNGQPYLEEISPGVLRVRAHAIPQDVAASLVFETDPGVGSPPPPRYCQVPYDLIGSDPTARDLLFLRPPIAPVDAVEAERYAVSRGLAFLPTIACSPELLSLQGGAVVITAVITQPTPGQVLTDAIEILGTVAFSREQAESYKVEIIGGQFPDWTTLGQVQYEPVSNGRIETLFTPALNAGDYQLRLIVVGYDSNFIQEPYIVPFTVVR